MNTRYGHDCNATMVDFEQRFSAATVQMSMLDHRAAILGQATVGNRFQIVHCFQRALYIQLSIMQFVHQVAGFLARQQEHIKAAEFQVTSSNRECMMTASDQNKMSQKLDAKIIAKIISKIAIIPI